MVRFVGGGRDGPRGGGRMFLSPKTVEAHLGRAYRKLGVHNRAQLTIALAREAFRLLRRARKTISTSPGGRGIASPTMGDRRDAPSRLGCLL